MNSGEAMAGCTYRFFFIIMILLFIQSAVTQTDSLNISWDRNPTEDSVAYYILYRARSNVDTNFTINQYVSIVNVPQTLPSIARVSTVDHTPEIRPGYFISYRVVAVDSEGLRSDYSDPEGVGIPQIAWTLTVIDSGRTTTVPLSEFLRDLDDPISQLIVDISQSTNLQVTRIGNNLTISPNPLTYKGLASFVVTVTDPEGFWDRKVVTLNVVPTGSPNQPPNAQNDQLTTRKGTAVTFNPLINDTDPNGDPILISLPFPLLPHHGTVEHLGDSLVHYTPENEYVGQDSFDYQISDGRGERDTARVNITILSAEVEGENTIAFPNPLKISNGQNILVIEPISSEAQELWLISPSGNLVYKHPFHGTPPRRLELSFENAELKKLASGLYIYLIKGEGDKKLKSGKVAILR